MNRELVLFCFKELRCDIMKHLTLYEQEQFNMILKEFYIPIKVTIPNYINIFVFVRAQCLQQSIRTKYRGCYNPLTKELLVHAKGVTFIPRLVQTGGDVDVYEAQKGLPA